MRALREFLNLTGDPPYMAGIQRSNHANTESAAQRQRIIPRAPAVLVAAAGRAPPPPGMPVAAAPIPPAGPLPAPPVPLPPAAGPGGRTLPATDASTGVATGALAGAVCPQPLPAGWAPALGGPPTSVRIYNIRPQAHVPDPLHWGWIFTLETMSPTVVLGVHSLIVLTAAAAPYIPAADYVP